jgi:hypothetical protein
MVVFAFVNSQKGGGLLYRVVKGLNGVVSRATFDHRALTREARL